MGLLGNTKAGELKLMEGPVTHLLVALEQMVHRAQSWGSPSVGCFPSASRRCCAEEMLSQTVAGKCRGESAVKINFRFLNTHALCWSAGTEVRMLVLLMPAGCGCS